VADETAVRDREGNVIGSAPGGHFKEQRTGFQSLFLGGREPASLTVPITPKTGLDSINAEPVRSAKIDLKAKRNPLTASLPRGQ
jgi:hypothetical protein